MTFFLEISWQISVFKQKNGPGLESSWAWRSSVRFQPVIRSFILCDFNSPSVNKRFLSLILLETEGLSFVFLFIFCFVAELGTRLFICQITARFVSCCWQKECCELSPFFFRLKNTDSLPLQDHLDPFWWFHGSSSFDFLNYWSQISWTQSSPTWPKLIVGFDFPRCPSDPWWRRWRSTWGEYSNRCDIGTYMKKMQIGILWNSQNFK